MCHITRLFTKGILRLKVVKSPDKVIYWHEYIEHKDIESLAEWTREKVASTRVFFVNVVTVKTSYVVCSICTRIILPI